MYDRRQCILHIDDNEVLTSVSEGVDCPFINIKKDKNNKHLY